MIAWLALLCWGFAPQESAPVRSFLEKHCAECHGADDPKGGLNLVDLKPDFRDPRTFATWTKVHDRVEDGEMPPKKKRQPAR